MTSKNHNLGAVPPPPLLQHVNEQHADSKLIKDFFESSVNNRQASRWELAKEKALHWMRQSKEITLGDTSQDQRIHREFDPVTDAAGAPWRLYG